MKNPPDIKKELVRIGKRIAKQGLIVGTGGNISARKGNCVYIKAKSASLESSRKTDYVCVDLTTEKSKKGVPSTEKYMHLACYRVRPDISVVMHLHPVFSTAAANSKIRLGPISYELLACLGSNIVRASYKPAHSEKLAKEISLRIKKHNAILMPNHGIVVVGKDVETAFRRAITVERACQTLIFSRLSGLFKFLPKKEAARIIKMCT